MDIVFALALLGAAVILFTFMYLGSRNPKKPVWTRDNIFAEMLCVLGLGLLIFGIGFTMHYLQTWQEQPIGIREIGYVLALVVLLATAWMVLAPRKRLERYAQQRGADIVPFSKVDGGPGAGLPPAPRKAA